MNIRHALSLALAGTVLAVSNPAGAVTPEEASQLKTTLTPLGAEKAGNKDGSIPAWDGGYTKPIAAANGRRGSPFKGEKPILTITAKNADQHAAKLTEGTLAMLKKYPDTYHVDVYPTHRTAAAPAWVYENTFKNATRAKIENGIPTGAFGGIPFPIAKTGTEVMYNHLLRWRGASVQWEFSHYQVTADGRLVLAADGTLDLQEPYYLQDGSPENFDKVGEYYQIRLRTQAPAIRAGEQIVGRDNVNGELGQGWVYLTGQRRVRKLPNPCCDLPASSTAGLMLTDELEVWTGRLSRFDWKLLGKKEMFIPYNTNEILNVKSDQELFTKSHLNPDVLRWELHRVYVVEATLKSGQRHQAPRSKYYCDEDTWHCVLADRWDGNGQLWRSLWYLTQVMPDFPATTGATFGYYDLLSGTAFMANDMAMKKKQYRPAARMSEANFTAESMSAEGAR
jgi:hypothetical protein